LSLILWRKYGKMSPKRSVPVPKLVEKYRAEFPSTPRPYLRRLIRAENPSLFKNNPSNLKQLDRWLGKSYKKQNYNSAKKEPSTDFHDDVAKAKEEWVNGDVAKTYKRIKLLINKIPKENVTPRLKSLIEEEDRRTTSVLNDPRPYNKRKPLLVILSSMIPQFLEALEEEKQRSD
jgi:hypothetical protein